MIQKCRDEDTMSYNACAAYLRKNAILIDHTTRMKPPKRLMHVSDHYDQYDSDKVDKSTTMSMEDVTKLFHSMIQESGVKNTYQMFKSKTFCKNLNIPQSIWNELEPSIKDQIMEIKKRLRE